MSEKLSTIKANVEYLLKVSDKAKQSDHKLIVGYWWRYDGLDKCDGVMAVLERIASNQVTSAESIRRCRQKLQAERPELRGSNYKARSSRQAEYKEFAKS